MGSPLIEKVGTGIGAMDERREAIVGEDEGMPEVVAARRPSETVEVRYESVDEEEERGEDDEVVVVGGARRKTGVDPDGKK